jgi:hypothetical protein
MQLITSFTAILEDDNALNGINVRDPLNHIVNNNAVNVANTKK